MLLAAAGGKDHDHDDDDDFGTHCAGKIDRRVPNVIFASANTNRIDDKLRVTF